MKRVLLRVSLVLLGLLLCAAIVLTLWLAPFASSHTITLERSNLPGLVFLEGMRGVESLLLDKDGLGILVGDCSGSVYRFDGQYRKDLKILSDKHVGNGCVTGIAKDPQSGTYYVGTSKGNRSDMGGQVLKLDKDLNKLATLVDNFAGLKGMTLDDEGDLYFVAGKTQPIFAEGGLYRIDNPNENTAPKVETVLNDLGAVNGLHYDTIDKLLYFSQTFKGVYNFDEKSGKVEKIFGNSAWLETFDDLCIDSKKRIWTADGENGFIKRYNPETDSVVRFVFKDFGITSSCDIRQESEGEVIYISEIKKPGNNFASKIYDGRGIVSIPLEELDKLAGD